MRRGDLTFSVLYRRVLLAALAFILAAADGNHSARAQGADSDSVTIATVERQPFVMRQNGQLTGFSIELWQEIARQLGVETTFKMQDSFKAMLQQVTDRQVDAAIANISITSGREAVLDFSQPIFDAGLQILLPRGGSAAGDFIAAIWASGLLKILGWAVLVLIFVAHLMWFIERGRHPDIRKDYLAGIWDAFWWALIIVTGGGFEDKQPQRIMGRALAVFWIIASLFVTSIFIAKITTALTVSQLSTQISSFRDLHGKKVGVTEGSTAQAFLQRHHLKTIAYKDIKPLFADVVAGKLDAAVHDGPLVQYFASTEGKGRSRVVGGVFNPEKYGIAFPQGSPLREKVNLALLRLRENGTYERLRKKWFGE